MSPIQIDIATSRRSRAFGKDERLWQGDLNRLIRMVKDHLRSLREYRKNSRRTKKRNDLDGGPTLSVAIFGPAGSGKSSLLKTVVREVRDGDQDQIWPRSVTTLDVIQPARFAKGDHLLYAVVAAALDMHREKHGDNLDYEVLTEVFQAYRKLSDDLRAVGAEEEQGDLEPSELAAEKIQRHTSGLRLSKRMNRFLDVLADDLVKEKESVILLPVDDLDLAPKHLFQALRELQAYLLHPRLIPIFTFTDRLGEEILAHALSEDLPESAKSAFRSGKLPVNEQLAIQYLAKCFPVRSRLRLGPSPALVQIADTRDHSKSRAQSQAALLSLVAASALLFGTPDRTSRHPVRAALRPTTLRRQLHVLDTMRQAGVDELINQQTWEWARLIKEDQEVEKRDRKRHWVILFNNTVWALMNVHRDVLREFDLHLEDLYSWSPRALRRVLLTALFRSGRDIQRGLWQRWRSLTDSRRSQVISLFAANVHRPWQKEERPSGEELQPIVHWRNYSDAQKEPIGDELKNRDEKLGDKQKESLNDNLPASHALLWFINVTLGFYLPLSRSIVAFQYQRQSSFHLKWQRIRSILGQQAGIQETG